MARKRKGPAVSRGGGARRSDGAAPVPGDRPTAAAEPHGRRRFATGVVAVLAASGLLATVTGLVLERGFDRWMDLGADLLGSEPIKVYSEDEGGSAALWGRAFALPAGLADPLPGGEAIGRVVRETAVPIGIGRGEVTLEGNRAETITVTSITAVVKGRQPALPGAIVVPVDTGGGAERPVAVGFDLDSVDLSGRVVAAEDRIGTARFLDESGLTLADGEKLRFQAIGRSATDYVEFAVEVRFLVGGEQRRLEVGAIRVTGPVPRYPHAYWWKGTSLTPDSSENVCGGDCGVRFKP